MRALFGILCLFSCPIADRAESDLDTVRIERMAEAAALVRDISAAHPIEADGLPDDLAKALDTWVPDADRAVG